MPQIRKNNSYTKKNSYKKIVTIKNKNSYNCCPNGVKKSPKSIAGQAHGGSTCISKYVFTDEVNFKFDF